jgi:hypothetical protein
MRVALQFLASLIMLCAYLPASSSVRLLQGVANAHITVTKLLGRPLLPCVELAVYFSAARPVCIAAHTDLTG